MESVNFHGGILHKVKFSKRMNLKLSEFKLIHCSEVAKKMTGNLRWNKIVFQCIEVKLTLGGEIPHYSVYFLVFAH